MPKGTGRTHAMHAVTPIRPMAARLKRLIFMAARATPNRLGILGGSSSIQFPRWVIVKRNQWPDLGQGRQNLRNDTLLFYGQCDGTWKQRIEAFCHGIPHGPSLFPAARGTFPWPGRHTAAKTQIVHNQTGTDYCYDAIAGFTERDVKKALRVHALLRDLAARHRDLTPEAFALAYRGVLLEARGCLDVPAAAEAADESQHHGGARWAEAS